MTFKIVQPTKTNTKWLIKTPGWVKEVEFLPDTGAGGNLFMLMRLEQDSPVLVAVLVVTLKNSSLLSHVNTIASSLC